MCDLKDLKKKPEVNREPKFKLGQTIAIKYNQQLVIDSILVSTKEGVRYSGAAHGWYHEDEVTLVVPKLKVAKYFYRTNGRYMETNLYFVDDNHFNLHINSSYFKRLTNTEVEVDA